MNRSLTQNWLSPSAITDFGTQAPSDWFRPVQRPRSMSDIIEAPLLPVRDTVLFPHMVSPLFVGRDRSVKAIEAAQLNHESVVVVTQRDPENEDPQPEDFYRMGTEVLIGRALRMPDGTTSVLAQGQRRAEILDFVQTEPYYRVRVRLIDDPIAKPASTEALMRAVLALFEKVIQFNRALPEDAYVYAMNVAEPGWLADLVSSTIEMDVYTRQELLELLDPNSRLQRLSILLAKELDVLELEDQIHNRVQREVDRGQREFYLREQMKAIQVELGEGDPITRDIAELREKLALKELPQEVQAKADKELERLGQMPLQSPETGIIRTYLDWLIDLPWNELSPDNLDVIHAAQVLDAQHYGLPKAKERILEYIAVRKLAANEMRSPILCFVGPPGTGKTSLGKSIAAALGRKFVRISLGGIRDEAEIRGHRRTYIGAMPGRIIQTMRRAETINPLFMLDEIDKIGNDFRGDPSAALLETLDPEQNNAFSDHYLEVPYDLSKVLFVTTANTLDPIPAALRDRMEVIEFSGYIEEEKVAIANQFLIPKQLKEHGIQADQLHIGDAALRGIIREYTFEAGVRNLDRELANIARKTARKVAENQRYARAVTAATLDKYLGPPKYTFGLAEEKDEIGDCHGRGLHRSRRRHPADRSDAAGRQRQLDVDRSAGRSDAGIDSGGVVLHPIARAAIQDQSRQLRKDRHPRACAGRRHSQRRPVGGHHRGDRVDLRVHAARRAARSGHDGRDHPARARTADRRVEGKSDGRASRRAEDHDRAEEERKGHGRNPQEGSERSEFRAGRAHG